MKRCLLALLVICFMVIAANAQRACVSYNYLQQQLKADPALAGKMARIEAFSANQLHKEYLTGVGTGDGGGLPVLKIPVVVHIVYNTTAQNISDAQVQSQIDVLNNDFNRLNADTANTPAGFKPLAADCRIEFVLANVDPRGFATTGILRRHTSIQYFGLDDRIKKTAIGGDDPWDADSYLNIWVCSTAGSLVGYASPVGGPKDKDGVVISYSAFGTTGTANIPFNKGRTATHEIGHWLGLRHIWGDQYCGNDYIDDTPPQRTYSFGCPTGVVITCDNAPLGNMYMNYMDLTFDACTNLFTIGQRDKMRSLFEPGGPRYSILSSKGASGNGLPQPIGLPEDSVVTAAVQIYPNPAGNMVQVDVGHDETMIGQSVTLHNYLGQLVLQARITKGTTQLNIQSLKEGIYFMRIGANKKAYKVIKTSVVLNP